LLGAHRYGFRMNPTWVWTQLAIVIFVVAGIVIAATRL
jgi:hypothetical protein